MRNVIDQLRRNGEASDQLLLLGYASGVLLQQISESLAGQVVQLALTPLQAIEVLPANAAVVDMTRHRNSVPYSDSAGLVGNMAANLCESGFSGDQILNEGCLVDQDFNLYPTSIGLTGVLC